ncbi:unnamed protein product [Ceratitis capitata]|uniref:(Mediterranean fruit fly) hypothetical protein n=1 Tax=Ceratitis capitata TaxID=7213 RepID=A0A811UZG8_CERCA|nr:unnamed protein product [Ceratitis capitata]
MQVHLLFTFLCCIFSSAQSQTSCDGSTVDFYCTTDNNVAICPASTSTDNVVITCSLGTICNQQTPSNGCRSLTTTSTTLVGSCTDRKMKRSVSSCASYYRCLNGVMRSYQCPTGTCYNDSISACVIGECVSGVCTRAALLTSVA